MIQLAREEASRVVSVLQGATEGVRTLAAVPEKPDPAMCELLAVEASGEGIHASKALYSYWQLEEGRDTAAARESLGGPVPTHISLAHRLKGQHVVATQRLVRTLAPGSAASEVLKSGATGHKPSEGMLALVAALSELTDSRRFLAEPSASGHDDRPPSPESDAIKAVIARQDKADAEIKTLEDELHSVQVARASEVAVLDEELDTLTKELNLLKKTAQAEEQKLAEATAAEREEVVHSHEAAMSSLQSEYDKLLEAATELEAANQKEKDLLRKRVGIMAKEAEKALQAYDTKMLELDNEFERVKALHNAENKRMQELEDHFRVIDGNAAFAKMEEDEYQAKVDARKRQELLVHTAAARKIQSAYRGFSEERARKEAEAKKSKKGKKGKKK